MVSIQAAPRVQFPASPKKFSDEKIIDVAKVNQRHWFEEIRQWLENVDRTHLVLAGGKPPKSFNKLKEQFLLKWKFTCPHLRR